MTPDAAAARPRDAIDCDLHCAPAGYERSPSRIVASSMYERQ